MNDPVRIVIADDHPMFLYGLGAALAGSTEVTVVGEARDGEALARVVAAERPAVVLTDLEMPGVDGTSAIANIRDTFPDIGVLVLTMHADDAAVQVPFGPVPEATCSRARAGTRLCERS